MKMIDIRMSPLFAESWNVAYRKRKQGSIFSDKTTEFHILKNNINSWCADPFLFKYEGKTYIFAEIYDYKLRNGTIGYTIIENGQISNWKQVIIEDYHLSYPYIFVNNGEIYIIPESSDSNSLYVYKAINFPDCWIKEKEIKKGIKLVDTTLFEFKNSIYAFTTEIVNYESQKHCLLELDNFDIINVIEINILESKESRMAGSVFAFNNELIKICQDCKEQYGGGLIFKRFDLDDLDGKEITHITPKSLQFSRKILVNGIHTYNANDEYEIIDIKTRRFNIINFIERLKGKFR